MSDILQSSQNELELYKSVSKIVKEKKISRFIGIGESLSKTTQLFPENSKFYSNTDSFLSDIVYSDYSDTAILLKGARDFKFEKISNKLQSKNHETVIEIDLNLMKFNLQQFKSLLKPETKMMVMVKAFSYGSGYQEVASFLQHNRIDYLAVAFADEGVELRNGGIEIPIMVMNPSSHSFKTMIEYKLEPEIYSISILKELVKELRNSNIENFPIHIKLDTGMHRLGLMEADLEEFCTIIKDSKKINIASIFTHLSGSDSSSFDTFTNQQAEVFGKMYKHICKLSNSKPDRHLANSAGIIRFPEYHFEMVRLGIGLYGLIPELSNDLIPVSRFKSVISQIRNVSKGESVSYNRSGKIEKESVIATIPVGYADGLDRRLGNGNWEFIINEKSAKTVGDICMDMCMIDITGIDAKEGDEVLIFSEKNSINKMAKILKTIPYEVITGISQRVKRVYFEE
jgi:alanine racemase